MQRDEAYEIAPYPGFGLWGFTRIGVLATDPRFQLAVSRLTASGSRDAILDLGCGLGQSLRQFAHAGVLPARLIAADMRADLFTEVGFRLFRDRERLAGATFVEGDVLNAEDTGLRALDGHVSIVHAANFFHLFSLDEQVRIGIRMTRFVQGREGEEVFFFGRHVASLEPSDRSFASHLSEEQYLHNQESFQSLWDRVGEVTGTRWRAEVEMLGKMAPGYGYLGEDARYSRYVVWRL